MKSNCENCVNFNNSGHVKDTRTAHAGVCNKWCEITFKWDTCKQFLSNQNKPKEKVFVPLVDVSKLPPFNQLELF